MIEDLGHVKTYGSNYAICLACHATSNRRPGIIEHRIDCPIEQYLTQIRPKLGYDRPS